MKKTFTLLAAVCLFAMADAQPIARNPHLRTGVNVTITSNGYRAGNFAADRRLREEAARINIKYDRKIQQVRYSYFMGRRQKIKKIHTLEQQRRRELNKLYYKHSKRRY